MHLDERPIAFFDSGVGGLPYLAAARRILPGERFVYLADRAGFPYGTKSVERVIGLALDAIGALVAKTNPKAIVVACNTATELAIEEIRAANPGVPVVGTVPAIKPAAALSKCRRLGVVATPAAAAAAYLTDLARKWAADCVVVKLGDGALVDFVEHRFIDASRDERLAAVRPSVNAMLEKKVDAIVLGCTHFLHLAEEFKEVAGPGVAIVDSRDGVAARLATILGSNRTLSAADQSLAAEALRGAVMRSEDRMYLTGSGDFGTVYTGFASLFQLACAGVLT
ncbi:MAG: glutamate racemase [Spirochaetes bacterium GWB1_48_6]|nr:MAG: glutamate racemase [Spirochaetes bacterium GWB1_48_6]